ncbi:MAG: hypothetical protein QM527_09460 [Alphaproteobacteria bacterium]|nr:hypothetical protein [Alphaproteobacteria bacterium]
MSKVNFDHLGRVIDIKQGAVLKAKDLGKLEKGVMERPLTQTNSQGPRDVARTEREILLDVSGQLERALATAPPELHKKIEAGLDLVKDHWLNFKSGGNKPTPVLLNFIARQFGQDLPHLSASAKVLAQEASKHKEISQNYDNTFGRQFESALVHELVKNPPHPVINAALQTGSFLFKHVSGLPPEAQQNFLKQLARNLSLDPRPWHAETPDVAKFLAQPDMAHLKAMLKPMRPNGYEALKMSWLGVKASLSFPRTHYPIWMTQADQNYARTIMPSRSQRDANGTKIQTDAARVISDQLRGIFEHRSTNPKQEPSKTRDMPTFVTFSTSTL